MSAVMDASKGGETRPQEDKSMADLTGGSASSESLEVLRARSAAVVEDVVMGSNSGTFGLADFGKNLRRLRQERKLTQELLAETANVSPRYVALIEAGARNPTLSVVLELASALQVPPYKLFKPAT